MTEPTERERVMDLQCVINGSPRLIRVRRQAPLQQALGRMLRSAGLVSHARQEWEMRDREGRLIDWEKSAQDNGLRDGDLVFVNLRAGVGA